MAELPIIRIAPNRDVEFQDIGNGQKLAIVDNFLLNPHSLISNVAAYAGEFVSQPLGHPSRGRAIGESQLGDLRRFIRSRLSKAFPFMRAGMILKAFLSNVSLKPEELSAYHRMCHIDPRMMPDHHTYAGVIYLFTNPDLGGTGFYDWKAKEIAIRTYELAAKDHKAALKYLEENSETFRNPPEYMTSSNEIAELLTSVPAKFNRLVFYNGANPHSAHITHPELLSIDPSIGRLTLNFMVAVKPT